MKRKTIALTLLCVMLMTLAFSVPTAAAEDGFVENGGFEEIEYLNGSQYYPVPKDWSYDLTSALNCLRVRSNASETGHYMRCSNAISVTSPFVPVTAGESYVLFFRTSATGLETATNVGHRLYYNFYGADNQKIGSQSIYYYLVKAHGYWIAQAVMFEVPENATQLKFTVNSYLDANTTWPTGGALCYDDFKVVKESAYRGGEYIYNNNLEYTDGTLPTNMKVDSSETGKAEIDKNMFWSSTQSLKVTGTTETDVTTVKTYFIANPGTGIYDISARMNLTERTAGSGVMLEIYEAGATNSNTSMTKKAATEFFDETGKGWRKMLLRYKPTATKLVEVRITFSGAGTVYLDDISALGTNNLIINGDLEGFSDDDKVVAPYGSQKGRSGLESSYKIYSTISTMEDAAVSLLSEENQNHYVCMGKTGTQALYEFYATNQANKRFCLSFDMKSASGYCAYMFVGSSGSRIGGTRTAAGDDWYHYSYYFTNTSNAHFQVQLGVNAAGNSASFDNLSLVEVSNADTLAIFDENGRKVTTVENGKTYTAKYEGFGTSTNDKNVSVLFSLYEKRDDGTMQLNNVQINTGSVKLVSFNRGNMEDAIPMAGEVPLVLERSFTIPNDGKTYELRAMALDGLTNMKAYFEAVTA